MADNDETGFKEMNQRFLDSAARGELQNLTSLFGMFLYGFVFKHNSRFFSLFFSLTIV